MTGKSSRKKKGPRSKASVLRAILIFIILVAAFQALIDWIGMGFWDWVMSWTAGATAWTLSMLGIEAQANGRIMTSSLVTIEVIRECTAIHPILIFAAAVLAYPCRWKAKLFGVGVGTPLLLVINIFRMVSLCFVASWYPDSFETVHMLVWQTLIVFIAVLLWILWASRIDHDGSFRFRSA